MCGWGGRSSEGGCNLGTRDSSSREVRVGRSAPMSVVYVKMFGAMLAARMHSITSKAFSSCCAFEQALMRLVNVIVSGGQKLAQCEAAKREKNSKNFASAIWPASSRLCLLHRQQERWLSHDRNATLTVTHARRLRREFLPVVEG